MLAVLLISAYLSAQQPAFDWGATCPSGKKCLTVASPRMLAELKEYGYSDGNGALEAFYKTHHSHRKAWLTVGILIGSGVATGLLATRASHPPIGRPIMPAMPAPVTPVFGGVTFVGIGGPGIPVVTSKGGSN